MPFALAHVEVSTPHVGLTRLAEAHRQRLRPLWPEEPMRKWWPAEMVGRGFDTMFDTMLEHDQAGRWLCHAVLGPDGAPVGQTSYIAPVPAQRRVEIGGTWYAPAVQRTRINPGAKRALLANAFAAGAERVELKTDVFNLPSRGAMEKMGAVFEGVHRRHLQRCDGSWRDSAWYSILRDEWPAVEGGLMARLEHG